VVLDDEKYFTSDGSNMVGNNNYYTNDKPNCPDIVRCVGKERFTANVLSAVSITRIKLHFLV
jgi:hypothetical protein